MIRLVGAKRWLITGLTPMLVAAWGCGGMAMGQGTMTSRNADDAKAVDAPLSVGGSIQPAVQLDLRGTAAPTLRMVSARPTVASVENGRLIGRAPGVTAILVTTKDGIVLDFYHLWVETASRATLHRIRATGEDMGELMDGIDMLIGESVFLVPKVYSEAQELAGIVPGKWSVEPPLASVLREGMADRRRIVARKPGTATLSFQAANVTVQIPIRVIANEESRFVPSVPPPTEPVSTVGGTP